MEGSQTFVCVSPSQLFGFQHAKILGPHETLGLRTVAPDSAELWQAPEVMSN